MNEATNSSTPLAPIDINAPSIRLLKDKEGKRKAIEVTVETRLLDDHAIVVMAVEMTKAMVDVQIKVESMPQEQIEVEFAKLLVSSPKQKATNDERKNG